MPRHLLSMTLVAFLLCISSVGPVHAQLLEKLPDEMEGVGIDDKRGTQISLDLKFRDDLGKVITLEEIFSGERPILLSLNYSSCPLLCRVQLNGLLDGLKQMRWSAGKEFDVVSVSIDPLETTEQARTVKQKYVSDYDRPGSANGWRFLTGSEENIRKLADEVGFRYKYIAERQEYSHTAALMVCTPSGTVSRYLYGVLFEPQTTRLSLVEASEGKVGTAMDQIILFCFHYDETSGRYGPVARRVMAAGGFVTVLLMASVLLPFWLRPMFRKPSNKDGDDTHVGGDDISSGKPANEPLETSQTLVGTS